MRRPVDPYHPSIVELIILSVVVSLVLGAMGWRI